MLLAKTKLPLGVSVGTGTTLAGSVGPRLLTNTSIMRLHKVIVKVEHKAGWGKSPATQRQSWLENASVLPSPLSSGQFGEPVAVL